MAISDHKRQNWDRRVRSWSYGTLIDQLEEILYLEDLVREEISKRNTALIRTERTLWTAEDA